MTTSQLRFRRKLADALYGEVTECELRPTARQRQRSPSIPLDEQLVVAVKCISLPYAVDMRARHGAGRNLDDSLQECRVASLLATSGGTSCAPTSTFTNTTAFTSYPSTAPTETSTRTSPPPRGTAQWTSAPPSTS
ncbi:hypothetical protein ON010_g7008 [Phytophthora cinnamomi]|nr:hypothetical protein ON010_g7008 [Phytophthora cinnamomi]